jgi:tetratricopeptide (TPR) repeat protein
MVEPKATGQEQFVPTDSAANKPPDSSKGIGSILRDDISGSVFKKGLVLLFVLGLIIRVAFLLEHARTPSFAVPTLDQVYYDTVAKMLLAGEDLHELHGFRPLLYPMFLAVCYKVSGSGGPDFAIQLQHLLGVGTGILVALLGARLFKHRLSGLLGGTLYLLAPVPLYFEGELLIEPIYIFLICLALLLHLEAAEQRGLRGGLLWLGSGALVVLAAQARANIMVLLAIYPLFTLWRFLGATALRFRTTHHRDPAVHSSEIDHWKGLAFRVFDVFRGYFSAVLAFFAVKVWLLLDRSWRRVLSAPLSQAVLPLCGLIGAMLMAVPWGLVNLRQSDSFHLLPNAGGVALYCGNKRGADGMTPEQERRIYSTDRYQDSIETWAREEYESAMRAQGRQPENDPMAISKYWTRRTFDEIKASPRAWLQLMVKKTWLTFWNAEVPNNKAFAFLQQDYLWLRVLPIRWVVLLALAPAGIWLASKFGNRDALLVLLTYALLYSAANIVFFICDRYRYPVWPAAAVFAGGGLAIFIQVIRQRQVQPAFRLGASALLMMVISLPNWFSARLPSFSRDYFFRSIAWYEKGHFQEALQDINRSVELYPAEASAQHHRGNVLFALNRFPEAEQAYEQALTLSPGEAGIWNNLGASLANQGLTRQALQAYRRATACIPPSKNAFLGAALIQLQLDLTNDATDSLNQFEKVAPGPDPAALALRSVIARKQGDIAKAETLEQSARRLDPSTTSWALQRASLPTGSP